MRVQTGHLHCYERRKQTPPVLAQIFQGFTTGQFAFQIVLILAKPVAYKGAL